MVYNLPVIYAPGGVDFRMPPTLRNIQNARDGLNFDILPSLHLAKRLGFQVKDGNDVGYGLYKYEKRIATPITVAGFGAFAFGLAEFGSPTTLGFGTIIDELVGIDDAPKKWVRTAFVLNYTGSNAATVTISAKAGNKIEMVLAENGSAVYTKDLGTGLEGSPVLLSTVETDIDAIADWTATTDPLTTSTPAAFLDFINGDTVISGTPFSAFLGYWLAINTPITTPLPKVTERLSQSDYENASAISINGVLYISNGFDEMRKYDGQTIYKAGFVKPNAPSAAVDAGTSVGATFTGSFKYRITHEQTDAVGNILESNISDTFVTAIDNSAGPFAIDVTVSNLTDSSGYNTACAIVDGTQTSTNIATGQEQLTVDDGSGGSQTFNVGDTAYFFDKNTSNHRELEILAVTGTTITVSSAGTISVDDGDVISNNLRIRIYRAEEVLSVEPAKSDYQLVESIPNDSFNSSQVFKDEVIPANLGENYLVPSNIPFEPPKGKYITTWRNQMIVAGDPAEPTKFYYSEFADLTNPENFPTSNVVDVPQGGGGRITGITALDRNLFIFLQNRIYVAEGNLADDSVRIDTLSDHIGCVAHASIQEIDGNVFFLSEKGVYRIFKSGTNYTLEKISEQLDPILEIGADNDFRQSFKRTVASVWIAQNKYLLFLPSETMTAGVTFADSDSRVFVFDLDLGYWYPWSNINAQGGMVEFDDGSLKDVIWFQTRETANVNRLTRFNLTNSEIDYADHEIPLNMQYKPQWDFELSPSTRKIYTDIGLDMFKASALLPYDPTGTITVETYRDFDETAELSFDVEMPSDSIQVVEPLSHSDIRAMGVQFSNNTINEQVVITGWTYEVTGFDQQLRRR